MQPPIKPPAAHETKAYKGAFVSAHPDDFGPAPAIDAFYVPDEDECLALWDSYRVPDHIRAHSRAVASIATALAAHGEKMGAVPPGMTATVRASALLHDIAKLYCVEHGGNHAQAGAAWVLAETGNPLIAQGVVHHVWWPFDVDAVRHFLPLAVLYADKRVRHDQIVSLGARYTDLMERYGKTEQARQGVIRSMKQGSAVELTLSELLEVKLNACTIDSGRLVY